MTTFQLLGIQFGVSESTENGTFNYWLPDIQPQLQKDNSKAQAQLKTSLDALRKTWPTVLPPSKPVFSGD